MFGHRIIYIGWAVFAAMILMLIQWLIPWAYSIFMALLILLPVRLIMMHWLIDGSSWYQPSLLYLAIAPVLVIFYVGFTQLACEHQIFLFGTKEFWRNHLCIVSGMTNAVQFGGINYIGSFLVLLIAVTNQIKPSLVPKLKEWQARLSLLDTTAHIFGISAVIALVVMGLGLYRPSSLLATGIPAGLLIPLLLKPFVYSPYVLALFFSITSTITTLMILPVEKGMCWFLRQTPYILNLLHHDSCRSDFPIYFLSFGFGAIFLTVGLIFIILDSLRYRYRN